jgi:hypothetical protein
MVADLFFGRVADVEFVVSHSQTKFIAIDEQPNDNIVQLNGSRKAHGLAHETFDTGA